MRTALLFLLSLLTMSVSATLVVDQRQNAFDLTYPPHEIGGPMDKRLAQTFTVGIAGVMEEVHLPIQCESGVLIVEIFELDGDVPASVSMLDRGVMEATSLPVVDPPEFRSIPLEELPPMPGDRFVVGSPSFFSDAGRRLAMVISNPTGRCTMPRGIAVDPYLGGHGFFDERPLPRGWVRLDGTIPPSDDLPFQTVMDGDPPSSPCAVFSLSDSIPSHLPVCRCLEDAGLREQRCALLDPSYFLIRRIPWPLPANEVFEIEWTLVPLTDLSGDIELKELASKKSLVFRAGHVKPGASVTLSYKTTPFEKAGTFAVETVITSGKDVQMMRSLVEVAPKK